MTKKFKRSLFVTVCLFFIISAPALILYSQGYRFDFANKKIVKVGGLFLKISPPGAKVYIDHSLSNKTNFFFDSAFIDGLVPRKYQIVIKKEGYFDWTKTLSVKEKQVTEAKDILLLPKNPKFRPIAKDITSFFPFQNSNNVFVKIDQDKNWVIKKLDLQSQKEITIVSQKDLEKIISKKKKEKLPKKQSDIIFSSLSMSPDSKRILLKAIVNGQSKYFLVDLEQEIPVISIFPLSITSASVDNIRNISFDYNDSRNIFFLADYSATTSSSTINIDNKLGENSWGQEIKLKDSLFVQREPNKIVQPISSPLINQDIIAYHLFNNNNIVWLNKGGFFYSGKINSNKIEFPEILSLKPLRIDKNANYKIIAKDPNKIFVKEDESIYYLSPKEHMFKKIFGASKELVFDSNAKKIAVRNENQIWLFYLEAENEQPQRVAQEKMLLASSAQDIKNLFWLNGSHILFQKNDKIDVTEIDNRSKPNMVQLATFPNPQIFWNQQKKILLVLSNSILYLCDNILR